MKNKFTKEVARKTATVLDSFYVWMQIQHHAVLCISLRHRKNWKGIGRQNNGKMHRKNNRLADRM